MIDDVLGWTMTALAAVAVPLALWSIYTLPTGPRKRCRGARARWTAWADLPGLFRRGNCWHDLTGIRPDASGARCCPECGVSTADRRPLRSGRRFRGGVLSLVLGGLALAAGSTAWLRGESWCRAIPTLPLVLLTSTEYGAHGSDIRDEAMARVVEGRVGGFSAQHLTEELMNDLLHDDVRWNATEALETVGGLWPASRPALEAALDSGDAQKRAIAAVLMRSRETTPSHRLLEACVEDLRDDRDGGPGYWFRRGNAKSAGRYLRRHYVRAEGLLIDALGSDDRQQREYAAVVCGFSGGVRALPGAVPVLVDMLRDNETWGDARMAAPALFGFGPAVIPHVRPYADSDDAQLRGVIRHLIERLEHPERTVHDCENRLPRITTTTHDALGQSWDMAVSYRY